MSASAHVFNPFHADLTIDAAPGLYVCMRGNLVQYVKRRKKIYIFSDSKLFSMEGVNSVLICYSGIQNVFILYGSYSQFFKVLFFLMPELFW